MAYNPMASIAASLHPGEWTKNPSADESLRTFNLYMEQFDRYTMGLLRDEVYSEYKVKLPRRTEAVSFYTKTSQNPDPNDTIQILDDLTSPSYSALCPMSRTLQTVPVRTDSCRHLETFDLKSCVMSAPIVDVVTCYRWAKCEDRVDVPVSCPVCKAKDKLHVDGLIETFLKSNPTAEIFKFTDEGEVVSRNEGANNSANETINLVSPIPGDSLYEMSQPGVSVGAGPMDTRLLSSDHTKPLFKSLVPFQHCRNPFYSPLFHHEVFSFPPVHQEVISIPPALAYSPNCDVFLTEDLRVRRRFSTVDISSPTPMV